MKPRKLDEIRDELACDYPKIRVGNWKAEIKAFAEGFDASTSHHQKIIADLVSALQEIVDRKGMGVIRNAEMIARQALAAYKHSVNTGESGVK
jgi:hypothetical protein